MLPSNRGLLLDHQNPKIERNIEEVHVVIQDFNGVLTGDPGRPISPGNPLGPVGPKGPDAP